MSVQETNLFGRVKGKEKHLSEQETMPFFCSGQIFGTKVG